MGYGKLNTDGTLKSANKQHEGFVSLELFEKKEDGSYYTYYLEVDGRYVVDTVKEDAEAKEQAKNQVNSDYEQQVNALTQGVPEAEIKTWTKQELEARGYLADVTTPTPLIDALCAARVVPKDYLVAKIIEKADMYAVAVGSLTGIRQRAEDELNTQA